MKPKALVFPNEPNFKMKIGSKEIEALVLLPNSDYKHGDEVILIPKNTEPWEDKCFLAMLIDIRHVRIGDMAINEIESCGFKSRSGLIRYYERFILDLGVSTAVCVIRWANAKEVDSKDYGYSAPNFGNQQSSAP